jgi:disulfide bond formation protein DsbB
MSTKLKNPYILLLLFSTISLFFAYFVEYIMHLAACPLCIYQRFPYLIFIMLSLISLSSTKNYSKYYIITATFAVLLAGYHTGIERGIFEQSSFCKPLISITDKISVNDFKKMLYNEQIGLCNKPALMIFGFSMAEWNCLLNIALLTMFIKLRNYKGII